MISKKELKDFEKGPKGIRYKALIGPWKIRKGEFTLCRFEFYNPTNLEIRPYIEIPVIEKPGVLSSAERSSHIVWISRSSHFQEQWLEMART